MQKADHFKRSGDGLSYAGDHLLLDFCDAQNLSDVNIVQRALEASAAATSPTWPIFLSSLREPVRSRPYGGSAMPFSPPRWVDSRAALIHAVRARERAR